MTLKRAADILLQFNFTKEKKYTVDVFYTKFEKKMSKRERKQLDKQIKYYQRLNKPIEIDRLLERTLGRGRYFIIAEE